MPGKHEPSIKVTEYRGGGGGGKHREGHGKHGGEGGCAVVVVAGTGALVLAAASGYGAHKGIEALSAPDTGANNRVELPAPTVEQTPDPLAVLDEIERCADYPNLAPTEFDPARLLGNTCLIGADAPFPGRGTLQPTP